MDGDGRPVVAAAVRVFDADGGASPAPPLVAADTDENGRIVGELRPSAAGSPVAVDHPDHPTWWGVVEANGGTAAAPKRFRVKAVLERGTAIDVIVEVPAGRRVTPARFRVGAVPGRAGGAAPRFAADGEPVPPGAVFTEVAAGVPTRLTRLVAGQPYHIFAVAEGWVPLLKLKASTDAAIAPQMVSAEPGLVRVPMVPLYDVDVTFCELDGTPIEGSPVLASAPSMGFAAPPELVGWATYENPMLRLAMPGAGARDLVTSARLVSRAACALPDTPDRIPISFTARVPGYEPTAADVFAIRCDSTQDRRQFIRMKRVASGFGTLKVRFRGPGGRVFGDLGGRGTIAGDPRARLALFAEAGRGDRSCDILLWALEGEVEARHVPAGRYRVFASLQLAVATVPKMYEVEIRADTTAEIELDWPDWSALDVVPELPGPGAPPYEGPLVVEFRTRGQDGKSRGGMWQFSGPPYRIVGFRPGHYYVCCRHGSFASKEVEIDAVSKKLGVVRIPMTEAKWR